MPNIHFHPKHIILISGKRYAGKDYWADKIQKLVNDSTILHFSDMAKLELSDETGLDYDRLINDRDYKEKHRAQIINLAESRRKRDGEYWAKKLSQYICQNKFQGVIISDFRFIEEYNYIKKYFFASDISTIRLNICDEMRLDRGWEYNSEVDDSESETSLDNAKLIWSFSVTDSTFEDIIRKEVCSFLKTF